MKSKFNNFLFSYLAGSIDVNIVFFFFLQWHVYYSYLCISFVSLLKLWKLIFFSFTYCFSNKCRYTLYHVIICIFYITQYTYIHKYIKFLSINRNWNEKYRWVYIIHPKI